MAFLNRPDKFLFYNKGRHKIFDACTCTKVAENLNSRLLKLKNTRILQIHPKISFGGGQGPVSPPPCWVLGETSLGLSPALSGGFLVWAELY